jgi:putative resolvase
MKQKQYLSAGEVAKALGVSVKTIQRWDKAGLITVVRTAHNQRRIPVSELARIIRGAGQERCVIYARVSSARQEQAGNLERQTERLQAAVRARGYQLVETIAERASSLNEKRPGMKKLFSLIESQAVDVVLIEYPDRLVRFGFPYLVQAFSWRGVRLEVLEAPENLEPAAELVADLLMIVTVFSGRLYGQRAQSIQKCMTSRIQACLQEAEALDGTN